MSSPTGESTGGIGHVGQAVVDGAAHEALLGRVGIDGADVAQQALEIGGHRYSSLSFFSPSKTLRRAASSLESMTSPSSR